MNKTSLYEGWKSKEKYDQDDPMEIDMVGKFKNNNTDNNTKYNNNKIKYNNYNNKFKSNNNYNNKYNNNNNYNSKYNNNKRRNGIYNYKNNGYYTRKQCDICDKYGHTTKECWFNPRNQNSRYKDIFDVIDKNYRNKNNYNNNYNNNNRNNNNLNPKGTHYIGHMEKFDINEEYNNNIDYEDLRELLQKPNNNNERSPKRSAFYMSNIKETTNESKNHNNNNEKDLPINTEKTKEVKFLLNINNNEETSWLYDSGAGEHLTNDKEILDKYTEEKTELRCANNTICTFDGYGNIKFKINNHTIYLNKVLYTLKMSPKIF